MVQLHSVLEAWELERAGPTKEELRSPETSELQRLIQAALFAALLGSSEAWAQTELTMPQLKVLLLLAQFGAAPVSWLAGRMSVSPPNITGILDRLEIRHLVQRTPDAHDRRIVRVALTSSGGRTVWDLCAGGASSLNNAAGGLGSGERLALRRSLRRLVAELDRPR